MSADRRAVYAGSGWGARLRSHRRAFADAWTRLRAAPLASLATLSAVALALLLPLLFGLGLANVLRFAGHLAASGEIAVFLAPGTTADEAEALARRLRERGDVVAVQVRTPEEGLAEFRQMSDLAGALDLLEANPLPFVLLLSPAGEADSLVAALATEPGVEGVHHDAAWRARLEAWLGLGRRLVVVLALLLAAGALLVVGNTVRLDLAARRDEIELMQLLGAEDADIRRPMLWFGLLLGLLSGALALTGALAVGAVLWPAIAGLAATYAGGFALAGPGAAGVAGVLAAAAALGWLGARVAAGHYLRTSRPPPA
ncbi:MAG: cell division protein FtsX [Silanimonas sp.]|nr:MAG: cell division protein FtsX [Silanimonas sp.]